MQVKLMKTMTTWLFQWNKSRRIWNIKKLWKYMSKISPKNKYGDQYMKLLILHFWRNNFFLQAFLDLWKNNPNQPQLLPPEFRVVLKIMATEQGLYAKMVMIRQNDSDNKKRKKKINNITSKVNPQDQCAGLILIMIG